MSSQSSGRHFLSMLSSESRFSGRSFSDGTSSVRWPESFMRVVMKGKTLVCHFVSSVRYVSQHQPLFLPERQEHGSDTCLIIWTSSLAMKFSYASCWISVKGQKTTLSVFLGSWWAMSDFIRRKKN